MDGEIRIASTQGVYAFELSGDVRMVLCLSFDKYLHAMFTDQGLKQVIFDLRKAVAVDSTTLGLMAKVALRCKSQCVPKPVLVTDDRSMLRLLDTMGFDEIFVISGVFEGVADDSERLNCEQGCEDTYKEQVLEAHRILMSLNEHNRQAFQTLVDSLDSGA